VKRVVALAALALALGLGAGEARAADECRGLQTCLPVEGPWVAVAAPRGGGSGTAVWQLRCPLRGYIVAGIDARVTDRAIDVSIRGENGAPVGPGVTTGAEVLFTAVYTGGGPKRTAFRPYIGCIPTSGGGARGETAVRRPTAFVPAKPLDRRVVERGLVAGGTVRVVSRCPAGTRLLGSDASFGFRVQQEPGASLLNAVRLRRVVAGRTVTAVATVAASVPQRLPVRLQVHALCTRVTR
jgi:hypothetical protein